MPQIGKRKGKDKDNGEFIDLVADEVEEGLPENDIEIIAPPIVTPPTTISTSIPNSTPVTKEAIETKKRSDKAAALEARRVLPKPPCKTGKGQLTSDQMWEYLALLTEDMWSHIMIYVYRHKPIIIRQLSDPSNKNYIDVISEPFDLDYMVSRHGGGKYGFQVNDVDLDKSLFEARLDIPMVQHDPILDYRELDLKAKDNMAYLRKLMSEGILDEDGKIKVKNGNMGSNSNGNSSGSDAVAITKEILGIVNTLNREQQQQLAKRVAPNEDGLGKGISDILLERMRQDDPNKQVTTMATLLSALKDMLPKSEPVRDQGFSTMDIVKLIQDANNKNMEMMKMMMEMNNKGSDKGDAFDQVEKILNISEMLKGASGGKRSGWDVAIDVAEKVATPLLTVIGNALALKASTGPMPAQVTNPANSGTVPQVTRPGMTGNGAIAPGGAFNQVAGQQPQAKVTVMPMPNSNGDSNMNNMSTNQPSVSQTSIGVDPQFAQALNSQGGLIIAAMHNGKAGYEFAEDLIRFLPNGIVVHAQIANIGQQTILTTMKAIPEFWNQIAVFGDEKIGLWVDEFINYERYLAELESGDSEGEGDLGEDEPEIVIGPAKGKGDKKK